MPKKDRNDYRSMSTRQLQDEIHYAVSPDWEELAIVLAERLDTVRRDTLDEMRDD